jgi:GNAT superfamily N-acetyltransferase
MRSSHSMPRHGMPSFIWRRSTTACGTVAGAPGSIRRAPRRARARGVTGSPEELPNIYHRKEYNAGLDKAPDYRLTCFFVDRNYRRKGVAAVALRGALDLIAKAGGGVVEAYPQDTLGKRTSGSFLYSGTRSLFEKAGLSYERSKGKNHCVMRRTVTPR